MGETYHEQIAVSLREWIKDPAHINVIHFAAEAGLSKEELFRLAGESSVLQSALDYAFTVMEWKVSEGALSGTLDRMAALKMLETYAGWKGEVNILQKNEYKQFMNEAKVKAEQILNRTERSGEAIVEEDVNNGE